MSTKKKWQASITSAPTHPHHKARHFRPWINPRQGSRDLAKKERSESAYRRRRYEVQRGGVQPGPHGGGRLLRLRLLLPPGTPLCAVNQRARRRWRRSRREEQAEEDMAVLRSVRRVHQIHPAAVPVPGHGEVVPPIVPALRALPAQRVPALVPVHGPDPQLLPAPVHAGAAPRPVVFEPIRGSGGFALFCLRFPWWCCSHPIVSIHPSIAMLIVEGILTHRHSALFFIG